MKKVKISKLKVTSFITQIDSNLIKGGTDQISASGCGCSLVACQPTTNKTK